MAQKTNSFEKFWQELKRRKVFKVVAMYAGSAFVIIQVVDILTTPLGFPQWIMTLVIILLSVGFPIVAILAWIFDLTPQGIKKTESIGESEGKEIMTTPGRRRLKVGDIVIAVLALAVIILAWPKIFKPDTLRRLRSEGERIAIAVMPFQNMTNDTIWNVWQDGIQNELITSLTSSEELNVRQIESLNSFIQSKGFTNYASITPSVARNISQKLDANVLIYGSIKQSGATIRLNAQLIDSKTEDTFKSFEIDGTAQNILFISDSLSKVIKDFLIISKLKKDDTFFRDINYTGSPEAYRYFIMGNKALYGSYDNSSAVKWYLQAINKDSTFTSAMIMLTYAYLNLNLFNQGKIWCLKVYENRDQLPIHLQILANRLHAIFFETPYESIKYLKQFEDIYDQEPGNYYALGWTYFMELNQYDKAIPEFEKALEIYKKWDSKPLWIWNYVLLGTAYHKTQQYNKEKKLYKKAEQDFPGQPALIYNQAILALSETDTIKANQFIESYISICKDDSWSEVDLAASLAGIYSEAGILGKAEGYYRQALSLEPERPGRMNSLAYFLIDNNRNTDEGLKLIDRALKIRPDNFDYMDTKGWGLYKQGKYQEALDLLQRSWDLRRQLAVYDHEAFLHLEAAKKAVTEQKN